MIREIGCYKFPGFYESIFCNSDEFLDEEDEIVFDIEEMIESKDFEVSLEYADFDMYKIDVCKTFMEYYVEKLIEILPYDITEHEDFKFDIIENSIEVVSPQYYNYSTDRCYCQVETNRKTLKLLKEYTLKLEDAEKYIKDHYTSYDGFISFLPNNIEKWKKLDIEDYEENMLIALLDMCIALTDCTAFDNIIESTFYDTDKYWYASPIVYCKKGMPETDREILEKKGFKTQRVKW